MPYCVWVRWSLMSEIVTATYIDLLSISINLRN